TRYTGNPLITCGVCDYCKEGRGNLCRRTIMLGSASTSPPTDGAFAEFVMVRADQCHDLPLLMDDGVGALMEPLAVALQAVKRAGAVAGKRVLVTGGGPVGLLVMLVARAFGATPVALSDVVASRRHVALKLHADAVLDPAAEHFPERVHELTGAGFDVIFEASGAPPALRQAFDLVRPGGTIVQIGTLGTDDVPLPANHLMVHEIQFIGSFRYGNVFDEAIRLVSGGRIQLDPLVSEVFSLAQLPQAMHRALAKDDVIKVQVQIS
ncbi:MAG: zinc-binding dehydrogenase, partial [Verrucomicrobiota bacterium]